MASVKLLAVAGSAVLLTLNAAGAADLPLAPPPVPVVQDYSGWYLRGDIGFSNQQVKEIDNLLYHQPQVTSVVNKSKSFDAAPFFGLGVGYQFNSWLRADLIGEYRANANFHGADVQNFSAYGQPGWTANNFTASKSEWLVMANAYVDLGTWWCVTPFIGAGIGGSYNRISNMVDSSISNYYLPAAGGYVTGPGMAFGADTGKWNFAWALHAGLAYKVTPGLTLEVAYRYLNLGDAASGDLVDYTGGNFYNNPVDFKTITSHDLKVGMRWMLSAPEPVYQPPLMRKG
ncbi:cell envelope biogenesis protein OmpA [Rhodoplanes elegans]|uniref:Cell envelope biogenesis protein OmpA n=1 Tax=Rhodoplanes elegans TaxID=29408 RepID=A0A327K1F9_9BRAD|nr:outer membrane beta-barrel protein [Rhodoplanes elegans]MBK5959071.1 cell envelope biogenesis protein OmpA [Rhodoplanes elegans]RAI32629.1 cell envelope biogenesis protein OmpA [Rhodoplanes elegans]